MADLACHGVPDTACRRTLIGEAVLRRMSLVLGKSGLRVRFVAETHDFRFGNAGTLRSVRSAMIPVCIGGKKFVVKAAVLPGTGSETPLLMSKELLRGLGARLDMGRDVMHVAKFGIDVPLKETERGHYALPLFQGLKQGKATEVEVEGEGTRKSMNETMVNAADTGVSKQALKVEPTRSECNELSLPTRCRDGLFPRQPVSLGDRVDDRAEHATGGVAGCRGDERQAARHLSRSQRRRARRAAQWRSCHERQDGHDDRQVLEAGSPRHLHGDLRDGQELPGLVAQVRLGARSRRRGQSSVQCFSSFASTLL